MAGHYELGKQGELMAVIWLEEKGFTILERNWRHSRYEIDIIAVSNDILHFIEVKTRTGKRFGEPEESVHQKKIYYLLEAGAAYQFQFPQWKRVQYDVLSITIVNGTANYFFIEDIYL